MAEAGHRNSTPGRGTASAKVTVFECGMAIPPERASERQPAKREAKRQLSFCAAGALGKRCAGGSANSIGGGRLNDYERGPQTGSGERHMRWLFASFLAFMAGTLLAPGAASAGEYAPLD